MSEKKLDSKGCIYYVDGMHCASCEVLIEKELLKLDGVESVDASTKDGKISIFFSKRKPQIAKLNKMFSLDNYTFSDDPFSKNSVSGLFSRDKKGALRINWSVLEEWIFAFLVVVIVVGLFSILSSLGLTSLVSIGSRSSLPTFFLFGVFAGLSSCAALVGGIVLSMSKQWSELYPSSEYSYVRYAPHVLFNIGRLISFIILGGILGAFGGVLSISLEFNAVLTIVVSTIMLILGLQMLGVKYFKKIQIALPKSLSGLVANESNFAGKYMPFLMGGLTFLLPCGFTISAQGAALASGSFFHGAMILFAFALGTLPMLLVIGVSSAKFAGQPHLSGMFLKTAGVLILLFGIYNINSQMNVLGLASFSDLKREDIDVGEEGFVQIIDGIQIMEMNASASGYSPNTFKIRIGIPVRWEITAGNVGGCTNAVIAKDMFDGEIKLAKGKVSYKDFTPTKVGHYKFSCWMGMVSGVIEVVDQAL